jgi:hypothetical protein
MNNRQIRKKDHKREGAVKKSRLTAIAVIAVMAIGVPGEAQAQAPLGPGLAAELDTHSVAQAASSSTASVLSDQAQTQLQVQTATSSAMGGTGGSAHNAGNSQTMNIGGIGGYGARNNPNIGLGLMVPTAPCRDTYSIAASAAGMGGALGWSKADRECRWQDIGAAFIRAGFIEDGLAMWCAIEGVEDIAPTCQRLKAAKELATRSAQTRPRSLDAPEQ